MTHRKAAALLAALAVLCAGTSQAQAPPAAPTIVGIEPRRGGPEPDAPVVVTGLVERGTDGSPMVLAGETVYEFPRMQHPMVLLHVGQTVRIIGNELPGSRSARRLLVAREIARH